MTDIFVEPITLAELKLKGESYISSKTGRVYPVKDGVPVFVNEIKDVEQEQVAESFGYKWSRGEYGHDPEMFKNVTSPAQMELIGFKDEEEIEQYFKGKCVLDAGCGSGVSARLYAHFAEEFYGCDISSGVFEAKKRLTHLKNAKWARADIMNLPFPDESFDVIVSNGVMHHTPDTRRAFWSVLQKLKIGGVFIFYIYKKKSPVREFTDDYIRDVIAPLSPENAWKKLEPLTKLAKTLSDLKIKINVDEPIDILGIPAGEYDLQRLLYWHFLKFYWNDGLDFESNNHTNFDWYHPRYAFRHTPEEVKEWLERSGCELIKMNVTDSGIGCFARRIAVAEYWETGELRGLRKEIYR